jgi:DNA-binding transcriptional MerR regulator
MNGRRKTIAGPKHLTVYRLSFAVFRPPSSMAIYSIGELEKLSGIKAHTIRVWEQRYDLLTPHRTEANVRYYDDDDLQLLLNVALLNRHGFKISKIASMSKEEIQEKAGAVSEVKMGLDDRVDLLTLSATEMDEYKFSRIFENHVEKLGLERTMTEVIFPFREKLSLLWLTGAIKPVQENFITQLIRSRLAAAIESQPLVSDRQSLKFLLYLPQGETEELTLLFVQYLLRVRKFQPVNMGFDADLTDVKDALRIHPSDYIFTILSESFTKDPVHRYLEKLSEAAPHSRLLLMGYLVVADYVKVPPNCTVFSHLEKLIEYLDQLKS